MPLLRTVLLETDGVSSQKLSTTRLVSGLIEPFNTDSSSRLSLRLRNVEQTRIEGKGHSHHLESQEGNELATPRRVRP